MNEPKKRLVTREMGKAETWLMNWDKRRAAETKRHIDRVNELDLEYRQYNEALPDDVRSALVAAKVIEAEGE